MDKYKIEIYVKTDADPSQLLDYAHQFGEYFEDMTNERCIVDEDKNCVAELDD